MSKRIIYTTVLSALSIITGSQSAIAQPAPADLSVTESRAYVGVVFDLDGSDGFIPDLSVGARSLNVKSGNSVDGADLNARISFHKGIILDSVRLVYVGGERDVQGNIGVGYSNSHSSVFGTAAIQGPYTRIGVDYEIQKKVFEPYLEINTLPKEDKPGCPINYIVVNGSCTLAPSDRRLKRQIKLLAILDNGIKIYSFKYLWSDVTFVGVMAQDLIENAGWKNALVTMSNGFYAVNYSMLGLQMTTQEQWGLYGLDSIMAEAVKL